jgi:hypothetical protein
MEIARALESIKESADENTGKIHRGSQSNLPLDDE